jgi:hypothetical protein
MSAVAAVTFEHTRITSESEKLGVSGAVDRSELQPDPLKKGAPLERIRAFLRTRRST